MEEMTNVAVENEIRTDVAEVSTSETNPVVDLLVKGVKIVGKTAVVASTAAVTCWAVNKVTSAADEKARIKKAAKEAAAAEKKKIEEEKKAAAEKEEIPSSEEAKEILDNTKE